MNDCIVFESTLYKFYLILLVFHISKGVKKGHIIKNGFINVFREQLDLFLKPGIF